MTHILRKHVPTPEVQAEEPVAVREVGIRDRAYFWLEDNWDWLKNLFISVVLLLLAFIFATRLPVQPLP